MDIKEFDQIFNRYQNMVYTIALRFTQNRDDALEVAQDVFVKIYHKFDEFRGESKVSTWIYRIAVNQSLMFIRGRKTFADYTDLPNEDYDFSTIESVLDRLNEKDRQAFVGKALNSVAPEYSVPLTLFYYDDLSVEEIAEVMQISPSNVKVRLHRGRYLLHSELEKILKLETQTLLK